MDGLNLYAYCRNNPVCYVDPSGNIICKAEADTILEKIASGNPISSQERSSLEEYRKHEAELDARQKAVDDAAKKKNINKKGMTRADLAASKGYKGVKATANGGADFIDSQYIYRFEDGSPASVKIKLTGSRGGDYEAANIKFKFGSMREAPMDDYVWHHVDDYDVRTGMATMQLIQIPAHDKTKPHAGSVKQYEVDKGVKYKR